MTDAVMQGVQDALTACLDFIDIGVIVGEPSEGLLRRAAYADGGFRDVTVMSVLRPDAAPAARAD